MPASAFFKRKSVLILSGILVVLIALRLALPWILLHYANKSLSTMEGYYGHVNDIDVALIRGAYVLDSFYLNKVDVNTQLETPFMGAKEVELSIEWRALFQGKLVGELIFEEPTLRFTEDRVELKEVASDTSDFRELLKDFMPLQVNRCEIHNGSLRYIDATGTPIVDMAITQIEGTALNLRNVYDQNEVLPARIDATGAVYDGHMVFTMKLNPLSLIPAFDLTTTVEKMDLTQLNDAFKAYGGFDVNEGEFNVYAEAATKDNQFAGYVKPIIKGLDVVSWKGQDRKDSFFQKVWESVVGGAAELFQNQKKDQLATKINFKGTIEDPQTNIFQIVGIVLQNAFVEALRPTIDNQISLGKLARDAASDAKKAKRTKPDRDKPKKKKPEN